MNSLITKRSNESAFSIAGRFISRHNLPVSGGQGQISVKSQIAKRDKRFPATDSEQ